MKIVIFFFLLTIYQITFGYANQLGTQQDANNLGYDQGQIDQKRDETIAETQRLLDERRDHDTGEVNPECIFCHDEVDDNYEGVISTADILNQTLFIDPLNCMEWEPVGICVWLVPGIPPSINFSVKVKNYVPDLVIQSYDRANGEPWTESQALNAISQGDSESSIVMSLISLVEGTDLSSIGTKGGASTQSHPNKRTQLNFKLVDAYGNPAVIKYMALNNTGYFCDSKITPFFPHYISNLDSIAWRWNLPEVFFPMSFDVITGLWDLGKKWSLSSSGIPNGYTYGGEYPRMGFSTGADRMKSAVLTAHRAAHFITRRSQPHLYFTIDEDDEENWWAPDPYQFRGTAATGKWQMLYPKKEDKCYRFPYGANPEKDRRSTEGSYVWNFWREYKCCEKNGAKLIFHFG